MSSITNNSSAHARFVDAAIELLTQGHSPESIETLLDAVVDLHADKKEKTPSEELRVQDSSFKMPAQTKGKKKLSMS